MSTLPSLRHAACVCILFVFLVGSVTAGPGFLVLEVSTDGGRTSNLLKDSSMSIDRYSTTGVRLNLYPAGWTEVNVKGEYTYYDVLTGLSNILYGGGLTIIPTSNSSRLSIYLTGSFDKREYREDNVGNSSNKFSSDEHRETLALGYKVRPGLRLRCGLAFTSFAFRSDEVDSRDNCVFSMGSNATLLGSTCFDLEAGYAMGNYQYIPVWDEEWDLPRGLIKDSLVYDLLADGDLNSIYISPRISRPIGQHTGISITYKHKRFHNVDELDNVIVYGYSTGLLSPWSSAHEGDGLAVRVKSFAFPHVIVSAGFGYWKKYYLKTLEWFAPPPLDLDNGDGGLNPNGRSGGLGVFEADDPPALNLTAFKAQGRVDEEMKLYLGIQIPLLLPRSHLLEPSVNFEYTRNHSRIDVYEHSDFSISSRVQWRF